jgi:hypothetical protein
MSRRHSTEETTWQKPCARLLRRILNFGSLPCSLALQQKTLKANKKTVRHELEYKANLDEFMRRKRSYDDNLFKAYALIWERCAKAMQNKIMARSNFENEIYNDPIKLLNAVKEHALNYQETRYEMSIISDSFRVLFNVQQKERESLQDYTRRYKTAREILESHLGGQIVLTKFVRTMPKYDENNPEANTECIENALEQLFAFLSLENADQDKYGSLLKGLNSQKSLGHDQYPRLVTEANNVLSNHCFDLSKPKAKPQGSSNPKFKNKQGEKGQEDNEMPTLSFAQMEGKCYCCGKPGHRSPDCRQKDKIPKDEWVINKSQLHATANAAAGGDAQGAIPSAAASITSSITAVTTKKPEPHVGWAGVHCSFAQYTNLQDLILLDSDSTDTIFCNPKYVTNITDTEEQLEVMTNGAPLMSTQKCEIPHLGECWYNPHSITNIIALSDMTKKFRVTINSSKEKAQLVHFPNKVVKFLIQTLEQNLDYLSPRQRTRAYKARALYEAMGTPTVEDLKAMIRINLIHNNKVTTKDVNLAVKAFGPDVGNIKGKATRRRPTPVSNNNIEIQDKLLEVQRDVVMSMDGLTVN